MSPQGDTGRPEQPATPERPRHPRKLEFPLQPRRCGPDEWGEALEVFLNRVPEILRPEIAREMAERLRNAGAAAGGRREIWAVRGADRRVWGALQTQGLPDGSALLSAPVARPELPTGHARAVRVALAREALRGLRRDGAHYAQAIIDAEAHDAHELADILQEGGLARVETMELLERSADEPLDPGDAPPLLWTSYSDQRHEQFARVQRATLRDSLDIPELGEYREFTHLWRRHAGQESWNPELWRVGRLPGDREPRAILLTQDSWDRAGPDAIGPPIPRRDVLYLGLAPEIRGRGLGRRILAEVLQEVAERGPGGVVRLGVDLRNEPAARLYRNAGFRVVERVLVFLARFDPLPDRP